jgi:hypothetical protein
MIRMKEEECLLETFAPLSDDCDHQTFFKELALMMIQEKDYHCLIITGIH